MKNSQHTPAWHGLVASNGQYVPPFISPTLAGILVAGTLYLLVVGAGLTVLFYATQADAATVEVYPTIQNAHGGTSNSTDLYSCLASDSGQQCAEGVPTFQFGGGEYSISVTAPTGYSYALGENCTGTLGPDDNVICQVGYADGYKAPRVVPTPPTASVAPQAPAPAVSTPQPTAISSKLTSAQVDALIGLLRAFGVDEAIIKVVDTILR